MDCDSDPEEWTDDIRQEEEEDEEEEEEDDFEHADKKQKEGGEGEADKQPRVSKAETREILEHRQVIQCKHIWETIRVKRISKIKKAEAMEELMGLVSGKCVEIIFKHDASRIIQCCLKYGDQAQKNSIAEELKNDIVAISKSQYGKFIVSKILRFCKEYRTIVITSFYGNVRKLIRHKDASAVIEECYIQFCNAAQRNALLQEFYGAEFMLFKTETPKTIDQLLDDRPSKAPGVIQHLRQVLFSILEKESMIIQSQTIVHRALLDYFRQITTRTALFEAKGLLKESSAEVAGGHDQSSVVTELIDVVKDHLVHILHTREGSQVTQLAILHASPKQRKAIIKTLKGFVKKIAMEQYGSACLLSLFECVDDTVLVGKSVIGELIGDGGEGNAVDDGFESLMRDKYASQVILYLLAGGRNKSYVTGSVVDELMKMDDVRAITSKKDIAVKQAELVKHLIPVLVPALKSCVGVLMRCKVGSVVMLETVKFCSRSATVVDGFQEFVDAIAGTATGVFACDDEVVEKTGAKRAFNAVQNMRDAALKTKQTDSGLDMSLHVIVNRVSAMMLKSMVVNKLKGEDVGVASPIVGSLSEAIGPNLGFWMDYCVQDPKGSNATGFVLLALWESEGGDGIREEMKKVGIDGARVAQWRVGEDKFEKSAKETGVEKLVGAMSK